MADKVAYYSHAERGTVHSARNYEEIKDIVGSRETGDYFRSNESTRITLYMDPANGLVVHDVEAYEIWLGANRLS